MMQVKCFECGVLVEGGDADAAVAAFAAHARTSHPAWTYPAESIRTYARNYVEATGRLSAATPRLDAIGEITVQPMTAPRVDDWLPFFDHDAFAGNPDWASCYCLEPHDAPPADSPERPWRTTRQLMADRLRGGSAFGYLAYCDGKVAGWVNASLRADYRLYRDLDAEGPEPGSVIGVSCFIVAPPYRRHGVAGALLDRVVADAAGRGAAWIEAYPSNAPKPDDGAHFRGDRSMYDARGFTPVVTRERFTVVRRPARH
jgi:GNAT superfamily N-acetyltransferase